MHVCGFLWGDGGLTQIAVCHFVPRETDLVCRVPDMLVGVSAWKGLIDLLGEGPGREVRRGKFKWAASRRSIRTSRTPALRTN